MAGKPLPFGVRADSRYGAPMGPPNVGTAPDGYCRVRMRRVLLAGGYDPGGAYWGDRPRGVMLFCAWTPDREFIRYLDATSYLFAQEAIREETPGADFL